MVGSGDLQERRKIGFQMEVSAKCGGELYSTDKVKRINIQGPISSCRWAITIDPEKRVPGWIIRVFVEKINYYSGFRNNTDTRNGQRYEPGAEPKLLIYRARQNPPEDWL